MPFPGYGELLAVRLVVEVGRKGAGRSGGGPPSARGGCPALLEAAPRGLAKRSQRLCHAYPWCRILPSLKVDRDATPCDSHPFKAEGAV
jgi:hypothetical protein